QRLVEKGVEFVPPAAWTAADQRRVETTFQKDLELTLTPLAVGPSHPFPLLANLRLYIALQLRPEGSEETTFALVGIPSADARLLSLGHGRYAMLEDVVMHAVGELFPGSEVVASGHLRVTRDGSIDIDEDQTTDLLMEIEEGLRLRGRGMVVRLEVDAAMPANLRDWLVDNLDVNPEDVLGIEGPIDLSF